MRFVNPCIVCVALLVNSCGTLAPSARQLHADAPDRDDSVDVGWQQYAERSAIVIGGVVVASCVLVARVRKLCVRIVAPERAQDTLPVDKTLFAAMKQWQARTTDELSKVQKELKVLRHEYDDFHTDMMSVIGRQANFNGFAFENDTVHALYRIIPKLFGENVAQIMRNVDGYFPKPSGKRRHFEIDAVVITAKRIFVVETKVILKPKDVDRLVELLENSHKFKFADNELNKALRNKQVHGGFSYVYDSKLDPQDKVGKARVASRYARDQHRLFVISRLRADKSYPKKLEKLRDFGSRGL